MDGRTDALTVGRMDQQPAFDSTGGKPPFLRRKNLAHLAAGHGFFYLPAAAAAKSRIRGISHP